MRGKIIHPYVDLDQLYYVLIRIVLYYVLFLYCIIPRIIQALPGGAHYGEKMLS